MKAEKSIQGEKEGSKQAEKSTSQRPCCPGVTERSQEEGIFGHDRVSGPAPVPGEARFPPPVGSTRNP